MRKFKDELLQKVYNLLDSMRTSSKMFLTEEEFTKLVDLTLNLQTVIVTTNGVTRNDISIPEQLNSLVQPMAVTIDETRGSINLLKEEGKETKCDFDEYINLIYKLFSCFRKSPAFNSPLKDISSRIMLNAAVDKQVIDGCVMYNNTPFIPLELKVELKESWNYSYDSDRMILDYFTSLFRSMASTN